MPEIPLYTENSHRLPDEPRLLRQAAEGDHNAFSCLYNHYYPKLYTGISFIARSHEDAQEILQDTFLKIWKSRETLILVRNFEDFSYTIAKNLLFNLLKREKKGQRIIQTLSDQNIKNSGPAPDQEFLYKQYYQAAFSAIDRLPAQKKQIFLLRTQQNHSLDEIASIMNIAIPTVKKHLYASISFVKEFLRQHSEGLIPTLLAGLLYFF